MDSLLTGLLHYSRLGRIARYAAGEDYHRLMREMLGALERWVEDDEAPDVLMAWRTKDSVSATVRQAQAGASTNDT